LGILTHTAPETGSGASIRAGNFSAKPARQIRRKTGFAAHDGVDEEGTAAAALSQL
jgi:hypothetical protein